MTMPRVDSEELTAYFDEDKGTAYIIYRGALTPETTIKAYQWIASIAPFVDLTKLRGGIFDFRQVMAFPIPNLTTARRESQKANVNMDMSRIPAALIVSTFSQEQMVRLSMKVTPQESRKRIVNTEEEALKFLEDWHRRSKSDQAAVQ